MDRFADKIFRKYGSLYFKTRIYYFFVTISLLFKTTLTEKFSPKSEETLCIYTIV